MNDGGYDSSRTAEARWGCIASAMLGVPVFMFLLVVDALGDCVPDTACKKGFLTQVFIPTVLVTLGIGLLLRWAVKTAKENRR
jgi:hypothetical protein